MSNLSRVSVLNRVAPDPATVRRSSPLGEPKHYVDKTEVDRALDGLEADGKQRPAALLRFLWLTGARVSEALAVRPCDLDFRSHVVVVPTLKRRQRQVRSMPLPEAFVAELAMLAMHEGIGREARLFPWSRHHAFVLVRDALVAAGVEHRPGTRVKGGPGRRRGTGRAHPHAVRHGHAIHALRHGASLDIVARALGHASVATTSEYLKATAEDVRLFYDRIAW